MGYVIAVILVVLIVAAGVAVFTLRAARTRRGEAATDSDYGGGTPGTDMAIAAPDKNTPLGDTDQHAGEQSESGETVEDPESTDRGGHVDRHPGIGGAGQGGVGGEGEGTSPVQPQSERLSNRPR
jgi:hypothetical protein